MTIPVPLAHPGADAHSARRPPVAAVPRSNARPRSALVAAVLGNGLEIYDFTVYSFFAVLIGKLFYPSESALASVLLSFATFGVGFVVRPLGAVLIGHMADRHGRKAALTLTITLMTVGTAVIAFLPTYHQIGITASVLLVGARLLQGLSAGGEVGAASALLMESAGPQRRCYAVSWQGGSQGAAALLGAMVGVGLSQTLSPEALAAWGWRVPFMLGLLIGPVGFYIRRHLEETASTATRERASLKTLAAEQWKTLVLGMLLMTGTTASFYIMVFYMPTYLVRSLGMSPATAFLAACMAGIAMLVVSPLGGLLADSLNRRKPLLYTVTVLSLVLVYPTFKVLVAGPGLAVTMVIVGGAVALSALTGGAGGALMMEALPGHQRATGMSVMYGFGVTVFGGFAPLIVTWLIASTGSNLAPAWYLMASMLISLAALILFPVCATISSETE